jgi:hypothetical protein
VDTPGIGSVNPEHGEATRAFIHRADAVIFLINTDPVIGESECNFLTFLKDYVNRFLFVVTKIDRFSQEERAQSVGYTSRIIEHHAGLPNPPMYPLSARLALESRTQNNPAKYAASGFPEFMRGLEVFLVRERGQDFIKQHLSTALTHLQDLKNASLVELQGLEMSPEDLPRRIESARRALQVAQRKQQEIVREMARRKQRIGNVMEAFSPEAKMRLELSLQNEIDRETDTYDWEKLRHAAETIPIFIRDRLYERLQQQFDAVSQEVASLREDILNASREHVQVISRELGAYFEGLQFPEQADVSPHGDADAFSERLRQLATRTVGSALAVSETSVAAGGGLSTVVLLGGALARYTFAPAFRKRVKKQMKDALDPALNQLSRDLFRNVRAEVDDSVRQFQQEMEQFLQDTVANIEATLLRLDEERLTGVPDPPGRRMQLRMRKVALEQVESELNLIAGPGW